jgi:oxaloacetate decarboxylase alpha subunit
VVVNGREYDVEVSPEGALTSLAPAAPAREAPVSGPRAAGSGSPLAAPLTGTISKVRVQEGQAVGQGDTVLILEAMKMETEVRAHRSGTVVSIAVREGASVEAGAVLLRIS